MGDKSSSKGSFASGKSGRARAGTANRSMSSTEKTNYKDLTNLPKISLDPESDINSFKREFGMESVSNEEIAAMFGALNGSKFLIKKIEDDLVEDYARGAKSVYNVLIDNDFLEDFQERNFILYKDGRKVIQNEYFVLKNDFNSETGRYEVSPEYKNQGIGTKSFARQAHFAKKHGVSALDTLAAKGLLNVGYYVWPLMGYNRDLSDSEKAILSPLLKRKNLQTVLDVTKTKKGKNLWLEYGNAGNMVFDLSDGSRSWTILNKYTKKQLNKKSSRIW